MSHLLRAIPCLIASWIGSAGEPLPTVQEPGGPRTEPPLLAQVRIGDEVLEVALGAETSTADGWALRVDLAPTRRFRVEGVLEFAYPADWRFLVAVGVPDPIDAWWTLTGEGVAIHMRRHAAEAGAVARQYLNNLASVAIAPPVDADLDLGGRRLAGGSCTYDVGSIGPGETLRWTQQVYSWQQAEGESWLLTIQYTVPRDEEVVEELLDPVKQHLLIPPRPGCSRGSGVRVRACRPGRPAAWFSLAGWLTD